VTSRRALLAVLPTLAGCGYHVSGRADLLPKSVRTIAIPAWGNVTSRHKLSERLPAMLTREFIGRTRYQVVADPTQADAVLNGSVTTILPYPTTFDPATGRASGGQIMVLLQARLTERASGKVLFDRPQFEARQRYEISVDQVAYFEESNAALDRVAVEVARQLVSAILENF
jgi:outer membrane lipopolysaccharide assembly protein LptE/RlpB